MGKERLFLRLKNKRNKRNVDFGCIEITIKEILPGASVT